MSEEQFSTEKRVLMAMRKTLAKIIRDLTPSDAAVKYPLSDDTVEDIKACFDLISSRERELAQQSGLSKPEKPRFIDDPGKSNVISIKNLRTNQEQS